MYQFPLIESDQPISETTLKDHPNFKALFKSATAIEPILFNTEDIVTKLTHQHLFTKFWIIEIENHPLANIPLNELKKYPVPILIHNFLKAFKLT
jgi:A/G-specific adenine glycosylase